MVSSDHFQIIKQIFSSFLFKEVCQKKQVNCTFFRSYISINFYNKTFSFVGFVMLYKYLQEQSYGDLIKVLESDVYFFSAANIY